jgi:transcriptional regulator with XRE-family HTH domain
MPDNPDRPRATQKRAPARSATPVDVHVGLQLQQQRRRAGFSQQQLAAGLGVSFQQVQKYENGANRISASRLYQLSRLLGVPISYFFAGLMAETGGTVKHPNASNASLFDDPETRRFVEAVHRIADPKKRRRLRNAVAALSENGGS